MFTRTGCLDLLISYQCRFRFNLLFPLSLFGTACNSVFLRLTTARDNQPQVLLLASHTATFVQPRILIRENDVRVSIAIAHCSSVTDVSKELRYAEAQKKGCLSLRTMLLTE